MDHNQERHSVEPTCTSIRTRKRRRESPIEPSATSTSHSDAPTRADRARRRCCGGAAGRGRVRARRPRSLTQLSRRTAHDLRRVPVQGSAQTDGMLSCARRARRGLRAVPAQLPQRQSKNPFAPNAASTTALDLVNAKKQRFRLYVKRRLGRTGACVHPACLGMCGSLLAAERRADRSRSGPLPRAPRHDGDAGDRVVRRGAQPAARPARRDGQRVAPRRRRGRGR